MEKVEFVKLEKPGDAFTGIYNGISKQKNGNFLLIFKGRKNSMGEMFYNAITISENMKYLLRQANKEKSLVMDAEIRIVLQDIIQLKTAGHTYKKYQFYFGNGKFYEENELNFLEQKDINFFLE